MLPHHFSVRRCLLPPLQASSCIAPRLPSLLVSSPQCPDLNRREGNKESHSVEPHMALTRGPQWCHFLHRGEFSPIVSLSLSYTCVAVAAVGMGGGENDLGFHRCAGRMLFWPECVRRETSEDNQRCPPLQYSLLAHALERPQVSTEDSTCEMRACQENGGK